MRFREDCVKSGRCGDSASDKDSNAEIFNFYDFSDVDGKISMASNDDEAFFEGSLVVQ